MEDKIPRSVGVHDGSFHADEVTACGLLILFQLVDKERVVRTRDPDLLANCEYVCDVGGVYDPSRKLFDHHQADYRGDFSSAGMILKYLKDEKIINDEEYQFFNNSLIKGVDAHDNGKAVQTPGVCTFSHVISNFAPTSYDSTPEELNETFTNALHFTLGFLSRMHEKFRYLSQCRKIVEKEMDKKELYLVFNKPIAWLEPFFALGGESHPALFVIMPTGNHWKLRGIPPNYEERMSVRLPLPQEWAGLIGEELKKVSGIPGALFCHKGRFTSVWETREDVFKALEYVLGNYNEKYIPKNH